MIHIVKEPFSTKTLCQKPNTPEIQLDAVISKHTRSMTRKEAEKEGICGQCWYYHILELGKTGMK